MPGRGVPIAINLYFDRQAGYRRPGEGDVPRLESMTKLPKPFPRPIPWICLVLAACGGGPTEGRTPTGVSVLSGSDQVGTVGSPLPVRVVFKVSDASGGVSGVSISAAVPSGQGGSSAPQNGTSDANGLFTVTWTLGGTAGAQSLTATASGGFSATAHATANAGPPSVITAVSAAFQLAVVGHAVPTLPVVKVTDAFGNAIPGVAVTFEALPPPGESLTGTAQTTDAAGQASLGSWTIGQEAVSYLVRGTIPGGAAALFETRGVPATVTAVAGDGQTANAGTAVPTAPAVRAARDEGSALAGVPVTFLVSGGGGRVDGGTVVTASDGTARPDRWVLGITPGANALTTQVLGRDPVNFAATGVAATPAALTATSPTSQDGFFGNYASSTPTVRVTDAQGNPVAGAGVSFAVTGGGGALSGASQTSDFDGRASLLAWRLGTAGSQSLSASAGSVAPVTFTAAATTPPAGTLRITVRYDSTCTGCRAPNALERNTFDGAAARWKQLLLAGGPPYLVFEFDNSGFCPDIRGETVDGLVIYARLKAIDGAGTILGQSSPCILRDEGLLPAEGAMEFDTADLPALEAGGQFNLVILHEMGHVLGFGTIWDFAPINNFLVGFGGTDPWFDGQTSRQAFFGSLAAGRTFAGNTVPVEATGGPGTAYSHWRESVFDNELMTGHLNRLPSSNPLSAVTVDQFRDMGYVVNDAVADAYTVPTGLRAAPGSLMQIVEGRVPGDMIVINRQGRAVARIPRR